jgi:hypothetical protein
VQLAFIFCFILKIAKFLFSPRTNAGIVEFHLDIWTTRIVQRSFVVCSVSEYLTSRATISEIAVKVEFIDSEICGLATGIQKGWRYAIGC